MIPKEMKYNLHYGDVNHRRTNSEQPHKLILSLQIIVGPPSKPKRYSMMGGTREQFAAHLEEQFPTEKEAVAKLMELIDVRNMLNKFPYRNSRG